MYIKNRVTYNRKINIKLIFVLNEKLRIVYACIYAIDCKIYKIVLKINA